MGDSHETAIHVAAKSLAGPNPVDVRDVMATKMIVGDYLAALQDGCIDEIDTLSVSELRAKVRTAAVMYRLLEAENIRLRAALKPGPGEQWGTGG